MARPDPPSRTSARRTSVANARVGRPPTTLRRRHRSTLRQLDRRALERAGWRTMLEFRENHVRLDNGQLIEVEPFWIAEAERDGEVIYAAARSESRAWSRLEAEARRSADKIFATASL